MVLFPLKTVLSECTLRGPCCDGCSPHWEVLRGWQVRIFPPKPKTTIACAGFGVASEDPPREEETEDDEGLRWLGKGVIAGGEEKL